MKIIKFKPKGKEREKNMRKLTDGKKGSDKTSLRGKQLLVGGLVLLVAISGYYRFGVHKSSGNKSASAEEKTVEVMSSAAEKEDYFTAAKRERDNGRSEAAEMLEKIAQDEEATADSKADAREKIKEAAENVKTEGEVESLIKSKGYDDCIVIIDDSEIRIVVSGDEMDEEKAAQIKNIVTSKTDFKASQIVLSCHK